MNYDFKVQIFIPVYNGSEFISECIKSLLDQIYKDFQICVVDNNSSDDTIKIIEKINDKRIKIFKNKKNIGALGNFNKCLNLATSKYFILLPCDDIIEKNYLNRIIPILDYDESLSLAFGVTERIDNLSNIIQPSNLNKFKSGTYTKIDALKIILNNFNPLVHPVIRVQCLRNLKIQFEEKYCNFSDIKLWTSIILNNNNIYVSNHVVSYIRVHSSSLQVLYKNMNIEIYKKINDNHSNLNYYNFISINNYNNGFYNFTLFISKINKMNYNKILKKLIISNLRAIFKAIINIDFRNFIIELLILGKIFIKFPILKNLSIFFTLILKFFFNILKFKYIK